MTGYLKNYNYDDRLEVLQPPYLFELASAAWRVVRETGCTPGSTDAALRLLDPGFAASRK